MKRILTLVIALVLSVGLYAQKDVTKFLGIPVDGTKQAMIQKLKAKGFTYNQQRDVLSGEFNGEKVEITVQTKGNKVWRLAVEDKTYRDEAQIKIRFNNLVRQFEKNGNYIFFEDDQMLSDDDDISIEISLNQKQYQAIFYQNIDSTIAQNMTKQRFAKELKQIEDYFSQFTEEQWENPTEEMEIAASKLSEWQKNVLVNYALECFYKKSVWFTIGEVYGRYKIVMFYENGYNDADGSEL